jgi:chloride channel 3/4/5
MLLHRYILPIMVSVIVSKWVGDAFGRDGIYDEQIIMNGYPHLDNKAECVCCHYLCCCI